MKLQYLSGEQAAWVRAWWNALQPVQEGEKPPFRDLAGMGRQAKAQLRRCSINELALEAATHKLAGRLLEQEAQKDRPIFRDDYVLVGLVAGALSHVREDTRSGQSLASLLGGQEAIMSELRFKRLLRVDASADFYRQLIRAIQLAKCKTDVVVLADDIIAWHVEQRTTYLNPNQRLKNRWARDYYLTPRERDTYQKSTTENQS